MTGFRLMTPEEIALSEADDGSWRVPDDCPAVENGEAEPGSCKWVQFMHPGRITQPSQCETCSDRTD